MRVTQETQRNIRTWVSFVAGLIWTSYFAFYNPEAMNAYFMTIGAAALFGPSVINMWKGGHDDNEHAVGPHYNPPPLPPPVPVAPERGPD